MPQAEYRKGNELGKELPQGAATKLNEAVSGIPESQGPTLRPGGQRAGASTSDLSPEEKSLYGPTERPDEPITQGAAGAGGRKSNPVPPGVLKMLPSLVRAARSPDAPPQLIQLVRLLNAQLGA